MMKEVWIPDNLSGSAAWVAIVLGNKYDAVELIGERLEKRLATIDKQAERITQQAARIAELERIVAQMDKDGTEAVERQAARIAELEAQLQTAMKLDAADIMFTGES